MTLQEAKENVGKEVVCDVDGEQKTGVIVSVGMQVFVKLPDVNYFKMIPEENIRLK